MSDGGRIPFTGPLRSIFFESFPDLVQKGHDARRALRFREARNNYVFAAVVAPLEVYETEMLELAWMAMERIEGRVSQLERPASCEGAD